MRLIYLYINKYCNLREVEFNFSPEMRLHFDGETGRLTASDTKFRLPERFWGENISGLSVVVGSNGAGKTSLMQAVIELFLDAHGSGNGDAEGILIFQEGDKLVGYYNPERNVAPVREWKGFGNYSLPKWLDRDSVSRILGRTKLIYLTNALTVRDSRRSQWYPSDRSAPLYDCSVGNLLVSDADKDVNQASRSGSLELESYLLYEQYKQIKFVFDKRQRQTCVGLKEEGYPMPVPERLYIDLLLDNRLSSALDTNDYYDDNNFSAWKIDELLFSELYPPRDKELNRRTDPISNYGYILLREQLKRCAIWCAVRSAANGMDDIEKVRLQKLLAEWEPSAVHYSGTVEEAWVEIDSIMNCFAIEWKTLKEHCLKFLQFIGNEKLEEHFRLETKLWGTFHLDTERTSITFFVDATDTEWFMEFLEKYRRICEPDYFLDFHWGLSSGENSLLSLFASLYYIFGEDYASSKAEDYRIINKFRNDQAVVCDSVILLIDEADLTYHPDWQLELIDLLTAFLPRIYPPQCCQDIQIILSTHSPILLSDVPQQNVIYLKLDPERHCAVVDESAHGGTFGQNIHLLFRDSFFLKNGTIGRFARRKIDRLFEDLKGVEAALASNSKGQTEELGYLLEHRYRPCAELIAEPIIRRKALLWIEELEQKLPWRRRDDRVRRLSDEELEREYCRLRQERDRRKHDTDFDL